MHVHECLCMCVRVYACVCVCVHESCVCACVCECYVHLRNLGRNESMLCFYYVYDHHACRKFFEVMRVCREEGVHTTVGRYIPNKARTFFYGYILPYMYFDPFLCNIHVYDPFVWHVYVCMSVSLRKHRYAFYRCTFILAITITTASATTTTTTTTTTITITIPLLSLLHVQDRSGPRYCSVAELVQN